MNWLASRQVNGQAIGIATALVMALGAFVPLLLSPARAMEVIDVRIVGDSDRTRIVLDLDEEPIFGVLRLTDPYRLVIDITDIAFAGAISKTDPRGMVSDYRHGMIAPGRGRIVLDLTGPADIEKSFVLPPAGDQPARVVLDLVPATRQAYIAAAERDRASLIAGSEDTAPKPRAKASSDHPVVIIDPGHGGLDSGAVGGSGLLEKEVTLKFASALKQALDRGGRVRAVLTREADVFVSLSRRVTLAREQGALLFLSLHADNVRETYVRGATVYTLSDSASDRLAAALARRENRTDLLAGLSLENQTEEVADILIDLTRRETRNLSVRFAKALVSNMAGPVEMNNSPWRRASFRVLKAADVPSALLELGYLSNKMDEKLLNSDEWLTSAAGAVATTVEAFVALQTHAAQ